MMATSQPQNNLKGTPTAGIVADPKDLSISCLSQDSSYHLRDDKSATSPPSLRYLSSMACPRSTSRPYPWLSEVLHTPFNMTGHARCASSPPSLRVLSSMAYSGSRQTVDEATSAKGTWRHYSSSESSDATSTHKKDGCLSSPCHAFSDDGKGCEKKTSDVVKGVHAKLRRKLKEGR
ncbi:uncharacterized protein LOC121410022 [Lytechinus variegatus]|uniref:uncharacterized protein LOC121410022 n=1 Tax=Lytechinus variegatus TaxID=7654 RepID=UPI001BB1683C|nr:uncharacterized protein LOC121410022 [Lytechinus variegatus]XP_041457776.1 uncharacterized protein LOC121410022 [Lytechinus variegatus]